MLGAGAGGALRAVALFFGAFLAGAAFFADFLADFLADFFADFFAALAATFLPPFLFLATTFFAFFDFFAFAFFDFLAIQHPPVAAIRTPFPLRDCACPVEIPRATIA